jgi:membrane protease YdiL (CAAX protease family)
VVFVNEFRLFAAFLINCAGRAAGAAGLCYAYLFSRLKLTRLLGRQEDRRGEEFNFLSFCLPYSFPLVAYFIRLKSYCYAKKGPVVSDASRELMWNGIAYAATAGAALLTVLGLYLFVPALRKRWFPLPRLRPGTWSGHEVFLGFCIVFGLPILIVAALYQVGFFTPLIGPAPDADAPNSALIRYLDRCGVISSPLLLTLTLGVLFAVMFARTGCRPHHYGLSWARWPMNLALGLLGFVAATPIVLGVFVVAGLAFPQRDHELVILGRDKPPEWVWLLMCFQATVAAPLLEEILLRGILQGWLRRATLTGHLAVITMTVFRSGLDLVRYNREAGTFEYNVAPTIFAGLLAAGYGLALYRLARRFGLKEAEVQRWQPLPTELPLDGSSAISEEPSSEWRRRAREQHERRAQEWADANAWLAIYGSAMLFAAIHSAWPAPVALFLLGLALAWLNHRTQSLIGPIVLHALFNLVAFIALYGSVLTAPPANGNAQTTPVRPSVVGSIMTSVPGSQLPRRK